MVLVLSGSPAGRATPQPASDQAESFGSTRGARVAYPMPAGERAPLVFLSAGMSDADRRSLEEIAPNVRIITGLDRESALRHAPEAHGIEARLLTSAFLERAKNLVWVHSPSAGVERFVAMEGLAGNERIVLTNSRAVHGPAIADHAFAMLLALTRNLRPYLDTQRAVGRGEDEGTRAIALQGKTMLVVGIGGIGTEIARRAHGFGMRVIATRRTDAPAPDFVERVGKPGDLIALLPEADVVAICVPLTAETERMFNSAAFAAMKPGAYLINIARGKVVDTAALVGALKEGRLAGACLDVTDPEPLPPDHSLRREPNVIITPHIAADAELTAERGRALLRENIRRFGAGEPLLNTVDMRSGY